MELDKATENWLEQLPRSGGFQVPEGYFEENERYLSTLTNEPELSIDGRDGGFTLPQDYFEKLHLKAPKKAKKIKLLVFNRAAAASVLLIGLGLGFWLWPSANNEQNALNQLTEQEIVQHLQKQDVSIDLLCDAGWCNELNAEQPKDAFEQELLDELSAEDLESEING